MSLSYTGDVNSFFGIASSQVKHISFKATVVVREIMLSSGDGFDKGQTIATFANQNLQKQIDTTQLQIKQLKSQLNWDLNDYKNQIKNLNTEKTTQIVQLNYKIRDLQAKNNINQILLTEQQGVITNITSPEIIALKKNKSMTAKLFNDKIKAIDAQIKNKKPLQVQINELETILASLGQQQQQLKIIAPFDGVMGVINYQTGETVPSFMSIITLHSSDVNKIQAFVHEDLINHLKINQPLKITTLAGKKVSTIGIVASIGSAIVEYPERLRRRSTLKSWGREILINLPTNNAITLGDKVKIQATTNSFVGYFDAFATTLKNITFSKVKDIKSSTPIEASGAIYLNDLQSYLLVTDERINHKTRLPFMDNNGVVHSWLDITVNIDDLESITQLNNKIYILSSLSRTKSGKEKTKRQKIVEITRVNNSFKVGREINLYNILKQQTTDMTLNAFLKDAINNKTLDIETMFALKGHLIIGFKAPFLSDGATALVDIGTPETLFTTNNNQHNFKIIKKLYLPINNKLSDAIMIGDRLYLTAIIKNQNGAKHSHLWQTSIESSQLNKLMTYKNLKAEGLAFNPQNNQILIVFDEGNNQQSKFSFYPIK